MWCVCKIKYCCFLLLSEVVNILRLLSVPDYNIQHDILCRSDDSIVQSHINSSNYTIHLLMTNQYCSTDYGSSHVFY